MSVATKDHLDKSVSDLGTGAALKSSVGGRGGAGEGVAGGGGCSAQKAVSKTSTRSTRTEWDIGISPFARLTINPIRCIVEGIKLEPNPDKSFIPLSLGESRGVYDLSRYKALDRIKDKFAAIQLKHLSSIK